MGLTETHRPSASPADRPSTTKRPITPELTRRGLLAAAATVGRLAAASDSRRSAHLGHAHITCTHLARSR